MFTILSDCQEKKQPSKYMKTNIELAGNLDLNNSVFPKEEIELKKYKFEDTYIENIHIEKLLDKEYRHNFFNYLKNKTDDNDFKATLFCKLLLIRIQQLKDSNSFFILSESSKDNELSSEGIELLGDSVTELFLDDPYFFIQQGVKYDDKEINNYVLTILKDFIVNETFFKDNLAEITIDKKMLLLNPVIEKDFTDKNLIETLKIMPKVEAFFSPSLYTGWKSKTIDFTNIIEIFGEDLMKKFNVSEANYYKLIILPILNKYIIQGESSSVYSIQDPDGSTNLRKEKNASSEILQKIKSGENIEVLDDTEDWVLIKTKQGNKGYVHNSRIKSK